MRVEEVDIVRVGVETIKFCLRPSLSPIDVIMFSRGYFDVGKQSMLKSLIINMAYIIL